MRTLIHKRYLIRQNIFAIIGVCLCFYFSWHALFGQRGYFSLVALDRQIEEVTAEYDHYHAQRSALEYKVVMLRPGSLDPDMLEERARYVLGYMRADEQLVLGVN